MLINDKNATCAGSVENVEGCNLSNIRISLSKRANEAD